MAPLLPTAWDRIGHVNPAPHWRKARGCEHCHNTGYRGRIGIYELIPLDGPLQQLVNGRAPLQEVKRLIRSEGHRSLVDDGLLKASRGLTSIEEVMRVAHVAEEAD